MMGRLENGQERLFYSFRLEDQVPANHLVRKLDALLDFEGIRDKLTFFYSEIGRPTNGFVTWVLRIRFPIIRRFLRTGTAGSARAVSSGWYLKVSWPPAWRRGLSAVKALRLMLA